MQTPVICQRPVDSFVLQHLQANGVDAFLAKLIAARPYPKHHAKGVLAITNPKLADLDNPALMQDMSKAVERVVKAIENQEVIALETDHDCDGQTAQAVLYSCFIDMFGVPKERLQTYIGHRLKEGYGLSDALVDRILKASPRATLVITADNGSSDEPRIARLKAEGIEVIVTDHHELPESGAPASAYACLNPTRADCQFPDRFIAGCMVAWLLMAGVRQRLVLDNQLANPKMVMADLLDFVAVGTVADCVSMAQSANNRAVVKYGLQLIRQAKRPCWQALLPLLTNPYVSAQDLGFVIAPLLNSDGRLSDALGSVGLLMATDAAAASVWAKQLWDSNQQRKKIQQEITKAAMYRAREQVGEGRLSIVVWLEDGHAGVHGISASRVKDAFGRPTILFSPKEGDDELMVGSGRSIDAVHLRQALQTVADFNEGMLIKFGGHKGAAGLTIQRSNFTAFCTAFEEAVRQQIQPHQVGPVVWTDGELPLTHFQLAVVDQLRQLEPLGREFEMPVFEADARLLSLRRVGADLLHAQLAVQLETGQRVEGIWFNCAERADQELPQQIGDRVHVVFTLGDNVYQNNRKLQIQVIMVQ
jgi:single-stranded-DNA-specific exonuclease